MGDILHQTPIADHIETDNELYQTTNPTEVNNDMYDSYYGATMSADNDMYQTQEKDRGMEQRNILYESYDPTESKLEVDNDLYQTQNTNKNITTQTSNESYGRF